MTVRETWRLLPYSVGTSLRHVALGDALARVSSLPTVWWHSTDTPTVIIGAGQRAGDVDPARCAAAGVSIVRRKSGGTAVYASTGVLGLDVVLPASHRLAVEDVVEAYRWFGEMWLDAVRALGVDARLISTDEAKAGRDGQTAPDILRLACFGSVSPYEVAAGNRKLVGLSQVRRRGRVLWQSGIHLELKAAELASLLPVENQVAATHRLREAAAGLAELTAQAAGVRDVMGAFERALGHSLGVILAPGQWSGEELSHADAILEEMGAQDDNSTGTRLAEEKLGTQVGER